MKQKTHWMLVGFCLLVATLVCPRGHSQDKAQGTKAQANKPGPAPMKLKVGDAAPDFKLQYFDGSDLKDVNLSQYRGKSNVVVAFYIFAFTGG